ncbi:MFS transporter [Kurthia sibirica]|uniref:MFS transporter n=2 Tax=Kurthia sibirica TaxID=202750 RepID=A0A2U3ALA9_9BACL|nr:MFS transporter [Kurthia sibirica]GEK34429.1 MFS transporter [Kurthia sibirica]
MMGIGIVTMLSQINGEYWLAGSVAATFAISSALLAPQIARLADRFGQSKVLLPSSAVTTVAVIMLLLLTYFEAPNWSLFIAAAAAGWIPNMSAMVRTRWAHIYAGDKKLRTAFSFESVMDEVSFIFGPIFAIGLSVGVFPEAAPLVAIFFLVCGAIWLTQQKNTEPTVKKIDSMTVKPVITNGSIICLIAILTSVGAIFGTVDVTSVAFAEQAGNTVAASYILSIYAIGSCLAGIVFGLLNSAYSLRKQLITVIILVSISLVPLLFIQSIAQLMIVVFFSGLFVAPTMIVTMTLVQQVVPKEQLTEGMTWATAGLGIGVAIGSSIAGTVIDLYGSQNGFSVAVGASIIGVVIVLGGYRLLKTC